MKFWVGTTDSRWFNFLASRVNDEVNFWQPSTTPPFMNAREGMPFLFKLKRPHNHIAGGGFFIRHSAIPLTLAWEIFGQGNGASSLAELKDLLGPLAKDSTSLREIGCQVIANPFFLEPADWLANPPGWSSNIVRGKMYESSQSDGAAIWTHVERFFFEQPQATTESVPVTAEILAKEEIPKFGAGVLIKPRMGQGAFRLTLTEAYRKRCAITGESTLPVLEAAHIVPYATEGTHDINNGLLLRADFHKLFDAGLVSVAPNLTIQISPRIREAWLNGKVYYRLHNEPLAIVPENPLHKPDPDKLNWHFKNVFQA
ncbi:MAG: restriction endonuclease [Burkholderiales bacterium PBB3]|nr:MAG: restriction endonuclease [Burkholderiales bacterium PBB3]